MKDYTFEFLDKNIQEVWEKAVIVPGYDKDQARHDSCGKLIYKDAYGMKDSPFGWVINRSGGSSSEGLIVEMKPLHWESNIISIDPTILGNCGC